MEKESEEDAAAAEEGRGRWGKTRGGAYGEAGRRDGERTMRERAARRWETTTMAFRRWWTGGGGAGAGGGEVVKMVWWDPFGLWNRVFPNGISKNCSFYVLPPPSQK